MTADEIRASLDRYMSEIRASSDQSMPNPGEDLLTFFGLVQNVIRARESEDDVPEDKRLLVLADDPPEEIDTEAITFFLKARVPGQWNGGPALQSRVREVVPHVRSIQKHPEHIGEELVTMGRRFDNVVGFNIYARDDFTALKRVLWLEKVLDSFRWYFRVYRFDAVIELGVGDKEHVTIGELELTRYPMSYLVRTEDTYQFGLQELKRLVLEAYVTTE